MNQELTVHLPRDKHDVENAAALVALGWERALPVIPQILEWTQDGNWPVARVFRPFLVDAGARVAPFLRTVFATDDETWKYFTLTDIVERSPELAEALHADLERMAHRPTASEELEGVSGQALAILRR